MMPDDVFYYELMGQPVGPCTLGQIRELVAAGTIRAETRIRRGESGKWRAAGNLRGFDCVPRLARLVEESAPSPSAVDAPRCHEADPGNPYAVALPIAKQRAPVITTSRLAIVGVVGVAFGIFLGVAIVSRNDRRDEAGRTKANANPSVPAREVVGGTGLTWDELQTVWTSGTLHDWGQLNDESRLLIARAWSIYFTSFDDPVDREARAKTLVETVNQFALEQRNYPQADRISFMLAFFQTLHDAGNKYSGRSHAQERQGNPLTIREILALSH